jgi:dihydroneopterin aldolase
MSSTGFSDTFSDAITIEGLEVECIIGLYDHERERPQRLVVEVAMAVDTEQAAMQDQLIGTVDYEWVSTQIAFILKLGRFRLLETAAQTICRALLLTPVDGESRGQIEAIDLSLRKPSALGGRGVPLLRMRRLASATGLQQETKPFGAVDIIYENSDVGFYRLQIHPGRGIGLHVHRQMHEAELVLSTGLHCQGSLAAAGSVRQWPHGLSHHYDNPTDRTQSLLCVDRPPFVETDEIPCDGYAGTIVSRQVWEL